MASSSADPDAAERAALIDRLNHFSRTTDRKTLVLFWEFERYVLRHPFAPRVRDGEVTRDQFHHSVAVETSRQSIAAFVDEVARAVELLPGAFAPPSFFDPERRFWARLKDLMVFACSRHASAYESVLSGAQRDVNCELATLRAQCRTQLRELREFRQQLQPQTASPDTFMRLVQEPPTQFAASLADRGVFLDDLLQVLPGFVTPSVEPVSMRTWQLASDSFVSEHFTALEEAAAEAIANLNLILKLDGDAPDFDAVCVLDAPQRDSVRLVLPKHLWDESKVVYLVAGPHSRLGAAIPSFRAIAVLRALCRKHLVSSAMRAHAYMPLVQRVLAESERWDFAELALSDDDDDDDDDAPAAPVALVTTPVATPQPSPGPQPQPSPVAAPSPAQPAASARCLSDVVIRTGTMRLLRNAIEQQLERHGPPSTRYFIIFSDIAVRLKAMYGGGDRDKSLLQKVSIHLRDVAKQVDVTIGWHLRKRSIAATRVELERLREAAAALGA